MPLYALILGNKAMKNIIRIYLGFLTVISVLWLLANSEVFAVGDFISLRNFMVQYFGVLAIASMSLIVVSATRPVWVENMTGGLDKTYRLHKWLGITALVAAIVHWLWSNGPKWAVGLGLMEKGKRGPRPDISSLEPVQAFFASQRGLAEDIGEWAFYIAVALMVMALIKWFPYRLFAKLHKFIAAAYLALAAHAMFLFDFANWGTPIGVLMIVMLAAGSVAAVMVLTGQVGRKRQVAGEIVGLEHLPEIDTLRVTIRPEDNWPGHRSGQFALVRLSDDEAPHPFTISSSWDAQNPEITLLIKALGDYTKTLSARLGTGDRVCLEGPYGRFVFTPDSDRQIWIAGGIGLTPFLARLEELARNPNGQQIDFYQVAPAENPDLMKRIEQLAQKAGVRLHVWRDRKDGLLQGSQLRGNIADWQKASVWFCGPSRFGDALRRDLVRHGLSSDAFHSEMFEFR